MAKKNHKSPEEARDKILDAAEEIVVEVGPAGLRISAVAKKAGMAHPNIIHHFGSRQGLLNALAERVSERSTARIKQAISDALKANENNRLAALTKVLDTVYQGDEGRAAVWLHLAGAQSSLKEHMQEIIELSHQLQKSISDEIDIHSTTRMVMLVTLALIGEVVCGSTIKEALRGDTENSNIDDFRPWLAELLLYVSDKNPSV